MKPPYAEDINYWRTGRSDPDTWMERAKAQIAKLGARVLSEGYGRAREGAAFMLHFEAQGEEFRVIWQVLPTRGDNERAARIQAATLLYHDVKAKCLEATVKGVRTAFFEYLLLPDGRTASEASEPELLEGVPKRLLITDD